MAVVRRTIPCRRDEVFEALVTPETYPSWLLGAKDIRAVDEDWPAVGSAFHHRVGLGGPLTVADLSKVVDIDSPRRLALEVRVRPFGRGVARFTLAETNGPDGPQTEVVLDEVPIGLLAPARPLLDPVTAYRNRHSLGRLADYLASNRPEPSPAPTTPPSPHP